jgi:hypothetical protein
LGWVETKTAVIHIRQDFPGGWETDETMLLQRRQNSGTKQIFWFHFKLFNWKTNEAVHFEKWPITSLKIMCMFILDIPTEKTVMVVINNSKTTQTFKTARFRKT